MSADRMSPLDATFLHAEDRVSHMHIGSVGILEGPPPAHEDLLAMVERKLHLIPRYRQVVRFVPFQLGRPVWVDDPEFDISYHIRRTALPERGGDAQLRNLVGRVMAQQLDRTKPLWEIWLVENLESDRWALLSKVHHCMVDGVSGAELLSVVLDIFEEPPPTPEPPPWVPQPSPSSVGLAAEAVVDLVRSPYEQIRAVRASLRGPRRAAHGAVEVAKGLASVATVAVPPPQSSLNGTVGPNRRYEWTETSVDDIKAIRRGVGGTFNDVVLAAITGGFRRLLIERAEPVDRVVRSLVPVSVRPRNEAGLAVGDGTLDNQVAAMFAELPVGIADPVDRLRAVSVQMAGLKESNQAVAAEALVSASGFAPPMLLALGLRAATKAPQRAVNTVTTNVPGPQLPL
jgi:diacylglycerol O-acyltransferase